MPSRSFPLRVSLVIALVSLVTVPFASASSAGQAAFSGKTCALFSAKQIAAIVGEVGTAKFKCVASKTLKTPAGTTYGAQAGAMTPSAGGFLSIQVVKYASPSLEGRVKQEYKTLMKPVSGVGDWAYTNIKMSPVVGGNADTGQFAFGAKGYGIVIDVRAKLSKTVSQPKLKLLAKQIAGEV